MSKFEDRLWSELVLDHGPQLAAMTRMEIPHRSRRGPVAIGAVALTGVLAAAVITATTGTSPSVAYAVTQSSDGSVTVSIKELSGVSGANAQLAKLHVKVRVATVEAGCTATRQTVPIPSTIVSNLVRPSKQGMTIQPNLVPRDDTLVISARQIGTSVGTSYGFYRNPAPSCVGIGDSHVG
ncbi:MAG: hypothetical protein ACRDJ3_12045 [Solirubrobacteraceae bacterium]